jgi:hypothetical protein
LLLQE